MKNKFLGISLFLFLLSGFSVIFAGVKQELVWDDSLDTAKDADYLTETEKAVIREMNMVRTNPKQYAEYLKEEVKLYEGKVRVKGDDRIQTNEGVKAINECIRYLEKAKPIGILTPDENMWKAAKDHATEQSKTGKTGHNSRNGTTPLKRMQKYVGSNYGTLSENIAYGQSEARTIVMQLLIDDGVPSRGHRKVIMNPDFDACGVSIQTHPNYRYICVINYIGYQ